METILLIVLFVAPGMICRTLHESFNKEKRNYRNDYDFLTHVVIDSVVVNVITILSINLVEEQIVGLPEFTSYLQSFKNILEYEASALFVTIIWCALKNTWIMKAYVWFKNLILKKDYHSHSIHTTDWDDMINEDGIKGTWQVMSIYKDGTYITSGMRDGSSTTNAEQFEIRLDRIRATERMLKEHPELFKIKYDYYNVTTGLRVIMYDQELLEEHWENKN